MTTHTQLKIKCLRCKLHFVICTWKPEEHTIDTIHCPECNQFGKDSRFVIWQETLPIPIVQWFQAISSLSTFVPKRSNRTTPCNRLHIAATDGQRRISITNPNPNPNTAATTESE